MNLDRVEVDDCRLWLANLPEDSVDLFMTSPPYWTSRTLTTTVESIWDGNADCRHEWLPDNNCSICGAWKGELGLESDQMAYVSHLMAIFRLVRRALKPTGSFYLNLGDTSPIARGAHVREKNGIPGRIEEAMLRDGWYLVDKSLWRRTGLSNELLFHFVKNRKTLLWRNAETGEWVKKKPQQRYRNLQTDEGISWDKLRTVTPPIMRAPIADMKPQKLEERRLWQQIWRPCAYYYDLDAIRGPQGDRVTTSLNVQAEEEPKTRVAGPLFETFPEEFCIRPILSSCPPESIVADPFAGSGTTLIVAKKLKRHYIGCDVNSESVKLARRRLSAVKVPVSP